MKLQEQGSFMLLSPAFVGTATIIMPIITHDHHPAGSEKDNGDHQQNLKQLPVKFWIVWHIRMVRRPGLRMRSSRDKS
jgi:hypothetical protein